MNIVYSTIKFSKETKTTFVFVDYFSLLLFVFFVMGDRGQRFYCKIVQHLLFGIFYIFRRERKGSLSKRSLLNLWWMSMKVGKSTKTFPIILIEKQYTRKYIFISSRIFYWSLIKHVQHIFLISKQTLFLFQIKTTGIWQYGPQMTSYKRTC